MILFPFFKGVNEVKSSKNEFSQKLNSLTKSDLHYLDSLPNNYNIKYAIEVDGSKFKLWKPIRLGAISPFINTTISCQLIENDEKLFLKYQIKYNIFSNILLIIIVTTSLLQINGILFEGWETNLKTILLSLLPYPALMWVFSGEVKEHKDFINNLTEGT
jgi:hypothetical protein